MPWSSVVNRASVTLWGGCFRSSVTSTGTPLTADRESWSVKITRSEDSVPGNALDLVCTVTGGGGLYYYWAAVPWTLRRRALETFRIYQVQPAPFPGRDGRAEDQPSSMN